MRNTLHALRTTVDFLLDQVIYAGLLAGAATVIGEVIRWSLAMKASTAELLLWALFMAISWYIARGLSDIIERLKASEPIPAFAGVAVVIASNPIDQLVLKIPRVLPSVFDLFGSKTVDPGSATGHAAREPEHRQRDWVVLALGVIAWLCLALALLLCIVAVCLAIPTVLKRYNFTISACIVVGLMAYVTLRPSFMRLQTWKRLKDEWLTLPGAPTVLIVGFGAQEKLGSPEWLQALVDKGAKVAQVKGALEPMLFVTVGTFFMAWFLLALGRKNMTSEDSQLPPYLFVPALFCAWIASAGFYTVTLYGFLVVVCTYLPA